jgi:hypothetical protein
MVTANPARKKLSLGDYMSRRLASTPSAEKSQTQLGLDIGEVESIKVATSPPESSPGTAKVATGSLRPGGQLTPQPAPPGALSVCELEDTSMKDEGEEPEYSPPEPVEPAEDSARLTTGARVGFPTSRQIKIPADVTNILHQLAQFRK